MTMLECSNITKRFPIRRGYLREGVGLLTALEKVSFAIDRGEVFGVVGESGCGKTTLGKIILGCLRQDSGTVKLATRNAQVIFQDPFNSLDPKMRVYDILAEPLTLTGSTGARGKIEEALDLVSLPKDSLIRYPHQFSGGQRQRIAIARAVITRPEFIVCDEPVSSLDVTIQLQILRLLKDIQKNLSATLLFISHDLRVIRFMCDRVAVMRQGSIVEEGTVDKVYSNPSHPYTKQLLSSILSICHK